MVGSLVTDEFHAPFSFLLYLLQRKPSAVNTTWLSKRNHESVYLHFQIAFTIVFGFANEE